MHVYILYIYLGFRRFKSEKQGKLQNIPHQFNHWTSSDWNLGLSSQGRQQTAKTVKDPAR